jgi:hypothetical protein
MTEPTDLDVAFELTADETRRLLRVIADGTASLGEWVEVTDQADALAADAVLGGGRL